MIVESARFRHGAAEPLVAAAFCCPFCLHNASAVKLTASANGTSSAFCQCHRCDAAWQLELEPTQTMPKQTSGMWTANDSACICRAWDRCSCSTGESAAAQTCAARAWDIDQVEAAQARI